MKLSEEKHYKEVEAIKTIDRLRRILNKKGIIVEEKWMEKSLADTYSLRLVIKGTDIGTNGKGITRELASASAYAEFFERFQNRALGSWQLDENAEFFVSKDERIQSTEELVCNMSAFMKYYFNKLEQNDNPDKFKIKYIESLEIRDELEYGLRNKCVTLPFFNVNEKRVEFLPYSIVKMLYGSNGMCAGNSREEALVQGISEIVERHVQRKLFFEKPTLPDIPEEYLKKFSYIYDRYLKMKEIKGYDFYFKDCSFGGKYPVAALIIIEKNTGNYGIKLGCHPNYGIAIERTITEITQGQEITEFCHNGVLDFNNKKVENEKNIINSFKTGAAQYPYQLLGCKPTFDFIEMPNVVEYDNKQILKKYLDGFKENKYTIYIRDESKLGFPSFHVIIPGISEIITPTEKMIKAYNTKLYLNRFLVTPKLITEQECKYFITTLKFFDGLILEDSLSSRYSDKYDCSSLPGEKFQSSSEYLMLLCFVYLKRYDDAANICNKIIDNIKMFSNDEDQIKYHIALYHYLSAMVNIKNHSEAIKYLKIYFSDDFCNEIDKRFGNIQKVIYEQFASLEQLPKIYEESDENIKNVEILYREMCNISIAQYELITMLV